MHKEFNYYAREFSDFADKVTDRLIGVLSRLDRFAKGTYEDPVITIAVGADHGVFPEDIRATEPPGL